VPPDSIYIAVAARLFVLNKFKGCGANFTAFVHFFLLRAGTTPSPPLTLPAPGNGSLAEQQRERRLQRVERQGHLLRRELGGWEGAGKEREGPQTETRVHTPTTFPVQADAWACAVLNS
jgi:hypothetical protein